MTRSVDRRQARSRCSRPGLFRTVVARNLAVCAVLVAVAALLTGVVSFGTAEAAGEFRYPMAADPEHLDPFRSTTVATRTVLVNIYEGLTTFDPQTGGVRPGLAESWDISDDGLTYTFHLREGVRFQQVPGVTYEDPFVTAEDWIWSFEMFLSGDTAISEHPEYLEAVKGAAAFTEGRADEVEGLRRIDDYTIEMILDVPNHRFLFDLVNAYVVPKEAYEQFGPDFANNPVGTGPFIFQEWRRDDHITLEKNSNYWEAGFPKLDRLTYVNVPDANTQLFQYRRDALDVLLNFPTGQVAALRTEFPDEYREIPGLNLRYLGFNMASGPFKANRALRLAVNYAIDNETIWNVLMEGARFPGDQGVLPPAMPAADVEGYPYDPERAKELLAEAGYPGGEGLEPIIYYYFGSSATDPYHAAIQAMLAEVGIPIELRSEDDTTYWSHVGQDDVHLFLSGWSADFLDPSEMFNFLFYEGRDDTNYGNPEVDAMIERATGITDNDARNALYRDIHEQIIEDAPVVPLAYSKVMVLVKPYVKDFYLSAAGAYRVPMKYVSIER